MNKINWQGVASEAVTWVLILIVALVNAVLQMFGIRMLPIRDEEIADIVSAVFLIVSTVWNVWKNRNITTVAQKTQKIADAINAGDLPEEDVDDLIHKIKP